jgi:hypothetical protein
MAGSRLGLKVAAGDCQVARRYLSRLLLEIHLHLHLEHSILDAGLLVLHVAI